MIDRSTFPDWPLDKFVRILPAAVSASQLDVSSGVEFQEALDHSDQMFKPGWKDIFRMNQSELESEIRKVYWDSTLDPRRKSYLVQNLLTRYDPSTEVCLNRNLLYKAFHD